MRCFFIALAVAFLLSACAQEPSKADHVMYVPTIVTKYVKLDPKLTKRCPKAPPLPTVGGAVQVAHERGGCVDQLNGQMDQIEKVQDTVIKENGNGA